MRSKPLFFSSLDVSGRDLARALLILLLVAAHSSLSSGAESVGDADRSPRSNDARATGVVILDPGSAGCLQPGDLVVEWQLFDEAGLLTESGELEGPMDLQLALLEVFPRGRVVLKAINEAKHEVVECAPAVAAKMPWRARYRPVLDAFDVARLESITTTAAKTETAKTHVRTVLQEIASSLRVSGRHADAAWLLIEAIDRAGPDSELETAFGLAMAELGDDPARRAHAMRRRGQVEMAARRLDAARYWLNEALALDRETGRSQLAVAVDHRSLANLNMRQIQWLEAVEHFEASVEVRRRLAPGSYGLISLLSDGAEAYFDLGRLDQAAAWLHEAEAFGAQLAPTSRSYAVTLSKLGKVAWQRSELRDAEALFGRALAASRGSSFESDLAPVLTGNLGLLAFDRGDMASAEQLFRAALEAHRRRNPESMGVANVLNNLGNLANERGLWSLADDHFARSLEVYSSISAESPALARALNNRANNAVDAGRFEDAEGYIRRALEITTRTAPQSPVHAQGEESLALVLETKGEVAAARDLLEAVILYRGRKTPGSLRVARPRHHLGRLHRQLARLEEALEEQNAALEIVERIAPGSSLAASILHEIGLVHRLRGDRDASAVALCRAADALDEQKRTLGGNRKAGNPSNRETAHIHRGCIEALLDIGDVAAAYSVLERSRVRGLLVLLAERDLQLDRGVPPTLQKQRRDLARRFDRVYGELLGAADGSEKEHRAAEERLAALRVERDALEAELQAADPRLAAIDPPRVLSAREASRVLDPGTLLLAYSIGKEYSHVFVLSGDAAPRAVALPAGRETLDAAVDQLRRRIVQRSGSLLEPARELWDVLLAPVAKELGAYDRLLISPDGSLHMLPFAALVSPNGRHLLESLPSHVVASMTLYAELRTRGESSSSLDAASRVVAFADPLLFEASPEAPALVAAKRSGLDLSPLPGARREAELLRQLYADRAQVFIGSAATEARLRGLAHHADVLHLATHGYVDPTSPLDSGLVLAASEEAAGIGLLQVWEIFEDLTLTADLVTLSACETALGETLAGEGMIGLTRAFHYAGAQSILASLWRVSDDATAQLMARFYRELRSGASKDSALRTAQLELLRESRGDRESADERRRRGVGGLAPAMVADAPAGAHGFEWTAFEWAAFELVGDRR